MLCAWPVEPCDGDGVHGWEVNGTLRLYCDTHSAIQSRINVRELQTLREIAELGDTSGGDEAA